MKKFIICVTAILLQTINVISQDMMTPEILWSLGRVSGVGISLDGKSVIYKVSTPDIEANKLNSKTFSIPIAGGTPVEIASTDKITADKHISPDGNYKITTKEVKVKKIYGKDFYPELTKSNAYIADNLNYRHWDTWEDGSFSHVFMHKITNGVTDDGKDIMEDEPFDCPQKPFGGEEDYIWSPDSKKIVYVSKKKYGTEYAVSTNTDIYSYDIISGNTTNLTEGMVGYDTHPSFSSKGLLAWMSMRRDGYESDKYDIIVSNGSTKLNLTQHWDGTVESFKWSSDEKKLFFTAPVDGTIQLFEVDYPGLTKKLPTVKQITKGDFDITSIIGQVGNNLFVTQTDMNHSAEIFTVDLAKGDMSQLTHTNDSVYDKLTLSKIERKYITTTDGKKMLSWVIYPPGFDPSKKYPTLLYCQGGPQSPLSQFYSFRWNFQLMAAGGYIIVAPNRRGMPGFGVEWNEKISKDHGGQAIRDYLSAIDEVSKASFVDKQRIGCVGASYGGYSVFYLAGIHENRFKTFISHDGLFNLKSMYGTTEELWFPNWDYGGAYWEDAAAKTYTEFDPSLYVNKWNTPILIIQGGKDYRVTDGQGFEAFQAAQLKGIKSKLVYFPDENHWVLKPQNGLVWQREFFGWLKETL